MWSVSFGLDAVFDDFESHDKHSSPKDNGCERIDHRSLSKNLPVVFMFAQNVRAKMHSIVVNASIK